MKINEILQEDSPNVDSAIRPKLVAQGYEFLGSGVDQEAYLAPDGSVLKIFGTQGNRMSKKQQSFIDFAEYCRANSDNPFLPNIIDFAKFKFNNELYLQIKMERLFEFSGSYYIAQKLADIAESIEYSKIDDPVKWLTGKMNHIESQVAFFKSQRSIAGKQQAEIRQRQLDILNQFVLYLGGEESVRLLFSTITDLKNIAKRRGYDLDLHDGNFMLGSDGHIVINDPFFVDA